MISTCNVIGSNVKTLIIIDVLMYSWVNLRTIIGFKSGSSLLRLLQGYGLESLHRDHTIVHQQLSVLPTLFMDEVVIKQLLYAMWVDEDCNKDKKTINALMVFFGVEVSVPAPKVRKKRKPVNPTKVFLDRITTLINNLLVNNKNHTGGHYTSVYDLLRDVKSEGQYILDEIEKTKHLVELTDEELAFLETMPCGCCNGTGNIPSDLRDGDDFEACMTCNGKGR